MESIGKDLSGKYGTGKQVLLSKEDYEKIKHKKLSMIQGGYVMIWADGKIQYLHRWLLNLTTGDGIHVDHADGDKLNCTRENIRIGSRSENMCNRKKLCVFDKEPSSKYKGVRKAGNRYRAVIKKDGVTYDLGSFQTEIEAAQAYNDKAKLLHQNYAVLNLIQA
jgi:hypothetical protein